MRTIWTSWYSSTALPRTDKVRAGIGVWWNHDHPLNVSSPLPAGMRRTNNVAEIQAAVEAIKIAKVMMVNLIKCVSLLLLVTDG